MASPSPRPVRRRRQRSVRVTVAVALLSVATAAVLLALPGQSPVWLSLSSVFALACGWAAARIVYTELAQSRREAAADRAAQAQAYRSMFAERANDHAEFTSVMIERLARSERDRHELDGALRLSERRAADAETRVRRETRRANEAELQVSELRETLEIRHAEQIDELAAWEAHHHDDLETVVDLMAWEERNQPTEEPQARPHVG